MKISVIIPTISGRTAYLEQCLRTCISQDSEDLEILVSDNSPGDAEETVRALSDKRIKYIRPNEYMPMSMHWDYCLTHASGDYVCFIGDDDGLMPKCIENLQNIIRECGPLPIHHSMANYFWADFPEPNKRNSIHIFHDHHDRLDSIKCTDHLNLLCSGRAQYIDGPMLYHCFIPKKLIDRIRSDGRCFHRSAPDVYSAVAIAANCESFISTGQFLTIFGQAAKANGASVRLNGSEGKRFKIDANAYFAPRFKSNAIQAMVLDALLEVSNRFNLNQIADSIDYPEHLSKAVGELPSFKGLRSKAIELTEIISIAIKAGVVLPFMDRLFQKTGKKFVDRFLARTSSENLQANYRGLPQKISLPSDIKNIYDATLAFEEVIASRHDTASTK